MAEELAPGAEGLAGVVEADGRWGRRPLSLGSFRGAVVRTSGSPAVRKAPWKLEKPSFVKAALSLESAVS